VKPPYCIDCRAPGSWKCRGCKAAGRLLARLHGHARPMFAGPALADREARIRLYAARAAARVPLFPRRPA